MIFSHTQYKGFVTLLLVALIGWIAYAVWPSRQNEVSDLPTPQAPKHYRSWEQRRDSMERADSIRYAQWAAEREQRYDSFRIADSMRRAEWRRTRQAQYDSLHIADSLWRDSIGYVFTAHPKRDTILDLNTCDTTELMLLRGIGRYTAFQIVRYREQLGGFYSPKQLTDEVFAKCHLDTILHHFTAGPEQIRTIPVNSASLERLQRHPYLRYEQAKAIYTLRRKHIRLESIEELKQLNELSEDDIDRIQYYLNFD